ncbi:hypothetical protein GCK32_004615 [Trichostrongylus colubriformis]|uniref:Uncharacterized protein n=1 Tax=Trichostrongylus colubriformis TaxID=6319 RepID=A0AAN8FHA3_TRICO
MDAVAEVVQTYRQDLEEVAEDLRRRGQEIGETAPKMIEDTKNQIEPQTQEIINAIQDTSDVSPPEKPIIEVFAWSTVMVLFANIGIFFGVHLLGTFVSFVVGKFGAALVAFIGLPLYAHYKIKQKSGAKDAISEAVTGDKTIRMEMLSYAILQGVLTGFVIDSIYLSYIPYAVVTPAIVAVSFAAVSKNADGNRSVLLGGTIGTAVGVNFTMGLIMGSLSFTYILLTLTYAGIAYVIMQLCLKHVKRVDKGHLYQNALSCGYIVAKGMFFLTFGSYYPDDQQQQQQRNADG